MAPAPLPGQGAPLDSFQPLDKRPQRPLGRLLIVAYSVCGMIATMTPLLLWMAWSPTVLGLTLLAGFLACVGIVWLTKFLPEYADE